MDFGFSRYDLNQITRRIELPEVSPDPSKPLTLIVRCASTGNRDFSNSLFKYAKARTPKDPPKEPAAPAAPPPEPPALDLAVERRALAEVYAGTAIVGWENATDSGQSIPFSTEAAIDLVIQLIEHVPDIWRERVRNYVDDPSNFRPRAVDPVDLGKG